MSFFEIKEWSYRWFMTSSIMELSKIAFVRPTFSGQYIDVTCKAFAPVFAVTFGKLTCLSNTKPYKFSLEHKGFKTTEQWIYTDIETSMGHVKDWKVGETREVNAGDKIGYAGKLGGDNAKFSLQCVAWVDEHDIITKGYINVVDYLNKMKAIWPEETYLHPVEIAVYSIIALTFGAFAVYALESSSNKK